MPMVPGVPGYGLPTDDAIPRRIQELERQVREMLPAVMAIFGPQLATLNGQVATLADVVNAEVSFAGNKGSVNAVVPPSSYGTACTADLTIPSWARSVVVLATASIGATSSGSPGGAVIGDILIDGAAGDSDVLNLASGATGHMTVLAQRTYTATPPTIGVSLSWYKQNAIGGASARLIAVAIVGR